MGRDFLETERLLFRMFELEDLDRLAEIAGDAEVNRFVGDGSLSRAEAALWIDRSRANVERYGYGTGAVVLRDSARLIGWAGFARPDGRPEELIYGLAPAFWGKGYGTELVGGLVRHAFDRLGHRELRATVNPENRFSVAILVRQGFRLIDQCYLGDPSCHLYTQKHPPQDD